MLRGVAVKMDPKNNALSFRVLAEHTLNT